MLTVVSCWALGSEGPDPQEISPEPFFFPGSSERSQHSPKGRNKGTGTGNRGAHLPTSALCLSGSRRDIKGSEGTETVDNA